MTKTSFSLDLEPQGQVLRCPAPSQVLVPIQGHNQKTVKKKAEVAPGTLVADHPGKNTGDVHASISGVVAEISAQGVLITAQDTEVKVEPIPTQNLGAEDLKAALKALGITTLALRKAKTVVVNGLNPEPGLVIADYLLTQQAGKLARGLQAVKLLTGADSCKLVSSRNRSASLDGCSTVTVPGQYPNSVSALAIKAATGQEMPKDVLCVDVHTLHQIGTVLESGLPLTEVLVSVQGKVVQARVGQALGEILACAGVPVGDQDSVILGGPLRGEAVESLSLGLPKDAFALTVVRQGEFPPVGDEACINCGACVAVCPARIQPNMVTRYSEFKLYDKSRENGIDACFECGLCGFWCTARRPMLQYIRLAKQELAAKDAQLASCALNE